ncbi:MAG: DUF2461 domain-containing protein [Chitinophagaceae bacterium]|nr:DUF2461 domain-containing protein [Chitinophagaceae bacterium]
MLQSSTLKFLKDLKKNNNKAWFDNHRNLYDAAKEDYSGFIQQLIDKHGAKDSTIAALKPKECLFRINRDIRFSKDKTPYKTNFGASVNKAGKKSMLGGYYFHLEPGKSFAGGGMYVPPADYLRKVRQEIDYNFEDFKKLVQSKKFKAVYGGLDHSAEYSLSRIPKGYEPGNAAAEFLKLKSYIAFVEIPDTDLTSPALLKKTLQAFETLQPVLQFLNASVEE